MSDSMTAREAVLHVVEYFGLKSYYSIARLLSDKDLTVQPIQISRYCKGHKMSLKVAQRFFDTFGIIISDPFDRSKFRNGIDNVDR